MFISHIADIELPFGFHGIVLPAKNFYPAAVGFNQSGQAVKRGGFTGAVGPDVT